MTIIELDKIMESEGFCTAPNLKSRVLEAAKLFNEGMAGSRPFAQPRLQEAFSTSDFPILLGKAFDVEVLAAYNDVTPELGNLATEKKVEDFEPKKLIDLFGGKDHLDDVAEKEEYKARNLRIRPLTSSNTEHPHATRHNRTGENVDGHVSPELRGEVHHLVPQVCCIFVVKDIRTCQNHK